MPDENAPHADDAWKAQVEAEKRAAQSDETPAEQPSAEKQQDRLPPPSLTMLVSGLYIQGMVGLGLVPNPLAEKGEPQKADLPHAQHTIDTLQMLYDKTQGNRTTEETEQIEHILHELRMAFVSVKQHLGPGQQ